MGDPGRGGRLDAGDVGAPRFKVWPPVAIAVPWSVGFGVGKVLGGNASLGAGAAVAGWLLVAAFLVWNGWCLVLFARRRTGLLPGQGTTSLLRQGPYRFSRNPLYVGLLALYIGTGLVVSSWVVLVLAPVAWAGLWWGAVIPEERYLSGRLGDEYSEFCRDVPRWL